MEGNRLTYGETSFLLTADAYSSMLCDIEAVNPGALRSDDTKTDGNAASFDDIQALINKKK